MPDRRTFIKNADRAVAGVAFTSCGLLDAVPARAGGAPARSDEGRDSVGMRRSCWASNSRSAHRIEPPRSQRVEDISFPGLSL